MLDKDSGNRLNVTLQYYLATIEHLGTLVHRFVVEIAFLVLLTAHVIIFVFTDLTKMTHAH